MIMFIDTFMFPIEKLVVKSQEVAGDFVNPPL